METAASPEARPYRSKRQRPCDVCRRRKHACRLDGPPPCTICRLLKTNCTFDQPPVKRRRRTTRVDASPQTSDELMAQQAPESPHDQETISPMLFSPLLTGWEGLGDLFPSHLQPSMGDSWLGTFEEASKGNDTTGETRTAQQLQDIIAESSASIPRGLDGDHSENGRRGQYKDVTSTTQTSMRPNHSFRMLSEVSQGIDLQFLQGDERRSENGILSRDGRARAQEVHNIIPLHMGTRLIAL